MKIGVISDTHIPDRADALPKKILEAFKDVDMVIHTGDFVDLQTYNQLKKIFKNFKAVAGNMDPKEIKEKLPEKEIIKIGKYTIGIAHGLGHPSGLIELLKNFFKKDNVDVIIFGHSHIPMNDTIDGILFFNPGSPTDKMFSPYNSYGIIEINGEITAKVVKI